MHTRALESHSCVGKGLPAASQHSGLPGWGGGPCCAFYLITSFPLTNFHQVKGLLANVVMQWIRPRLSSHEGLPEPLFMICDHGELNVSGSWSTLMT